MSITCIYMYTAGKSNEFLTSADYPVGFGVNSDNNPSTAEAEIISQIAALANRRKYLTFPSRLLKNSLWGLLRPTLGDTKCLAKPVDRSEGI